MKYFIGNTDIRWYNFLKDRKPEEINFWQPNSHGNFRAILKGAPFLFRIKSPVDKVGGLAFFSHYTTLPVSMAWDIFEESNGCDSREELNGMLMKYRTDKATVNPVIGCIILSDPVFFDENDWLQLPQDWSKNIVVGKTYSMSEGIGKEYWKNIEVILKKKQFDKRAYNNEIIIPDRVDDEYSRKYLTKVRTGQGAFRVEVMDAYSRRCAITGEKTLPALEASHIKAYSAKGPNVISNGVFLRSDIHTLFDEGYITITKEHNIEVSNRIRKEFENGKEYYKYHGNMLQVLPVRDLEKPNKEFLEWHNKNIYKG